MKRILVLLIALSVAVWAPLQAQETPAVPDAERLAAAREMMEATGVTKSLEGVIASMSKGMEQGAKSSGHELGKEVSAELDAMMQKFLSYKEDMLNDFAAIYAETFTAAEMKEVTAFYKSGTGAKFIAEMPSLMQKGSLIGVKYSQKVIGEMGAAKK